MACHKEFMVARNHQFCSIKDTTGLAGLLGIGEPLLYRLRFEKAYTVFEVKKKQGKSRLIEAPQKELKVALRRLNDYLQSSYFFNRTSSAYGFVQQPRNAKRKRNILTNARLHSGKNYMLNVDLEDFFHQVSKGKVLTIFKSRPFSFQTELAAFLAEFTTYNNRLPMGSPTSPALSNFSCIEMDRELETMARSNKIIYSRYVDDLTFSSNEPIHAGIFNDIQQILTGHSYRINMKKVSWMGETDQKIVTGLILKDRPHVTAAFLNDLEKNLRRFKHVLEFSAVSVSGVSGEWIDNFKQHLQGKLRFLQMVYGCNSPVYNKMSHLFADAFNTKPFAESFNWNNFPYF